MGGAEAVPAGREELVSDDSHAPGRGDGVTMAEAIGAAYSSSYSSNVVVHGSFPTLRTGTNPAPTRRATGAASTNAAGLHADDLVDLGAEEVLGQAVHHHAEGLRVRQQRGDVLEPDAGLGKVGHIADPGRQPGRAVQLDGLDGLSHGCTAVRRGPPMAQTTS